MRQTANDLVVTKMQAHELAVRYAAFGEACRNDDDSGIVVWGEMLVEVMAETGLALMDAENIANLVGYSRERLNAAKEKAA